MRATMRHRQPAKAGCVGAPVRRNKKIEISNDK